jgi:hypothetical protein
MNKHIMCNNFLTVREKKCLEQNILKIMQRTSKFQLNLSITVFLSSESDVNYSFEIEDTKNSTDMERKQTTML